MVRPETIQTSLQDCFQNQFSPNAAGEKASPWLLPVENVSAVCMGRKLQQESGGEADSNWGCLKENKVKVSGSLAALECLPQL